jgi:predicted branched-subunit amino acid permease
VWWKTPHAGGSTSRSPPCCLALIAGMWSGKSDILPWTVAAAVAVAAHHWLPGQWYILLGGLAGSFAGVVRRGR